MFYFITADTMTNIDVIFFFQISSDKENKHDDQGNWRHVH